MTDTDPMLEALDALDRCDRAVTRLHKMCCEPGRSPEMAAVESALGDVRHHLGRAAGGAYDLDDVLSELETIGARIGRLQVGCCATARMPLYAETLAGLTDIQLAINRSRGTGH